MPLPPTTMTGLLGKEVHTANGKHLYVVGADREIGITMHDIETDEELFCINREHLMRVMKSPDKLRQYHEAFSSVVDIIESGYMSTAPVFMSKGFKYFEMEPIMTACLGNFQPCAFR